MKDHKKVPLIHSKSDMCKLRVYIYLIRVPFCACQKSYGFKNMVKLGGGQTNFKITLGTRVFKKSCSTSKLAGVGAVFDKFHVFFCSKSRACQLASMPSQTKPSGLKPSRPTTKPSKPSTSLASSSQAKARKLNTTNSSKRHRKASFG